MTKRFFLDTEFLEDGVTIDPVSLALVTDELGGPELYIEFHPSTWRQEPNQFVVENVLPHLVLPMHERVKDFRVAQLAIMDFIVDVMTRRPDGERLPTNEEPEIWAYYADYDWVLFCRLWGQMMDLPVWMPKWCRDLKQTMWHLGLTSDDFPPHDAKVFGPAHNCLADARRNADSWRRCWEHAHLHGIQMVNL